MLAKRILGILKQYPNPEVAFYATEVLLGYTGSSYFHVCPERGRGTRDRFWTTYVAAVSEHQGYRRTYSREVSGDALIAEHACATERTDNYVGRMQLAHDVREQGTDLPALIRGYVTDGHWYTNAPLTENAPTEVLAPWVAAWVNRWLKGFAAIQTVREHWAHYAAIKLLAENISELADYVSQNRVDPGRLTLNQLIYRSRRWHAALNKALKAQDRREMAKLTPPSNRVFDDGAYGVFQLDADEALHHEGKIMQHCVAGYTTRVRGGECAIYSVRDAANLSYATLEVRGGDVWQIKGIKNAAIKDPDLCQVIANFIAHAGFVNHTDSCQLEPAPLEIEPGGEDELPAGLGMFGRMAGYGFGSVHGARLITDAEFDAAQDRLDALHRRTRRGTVGTAEQIAHYRAAWHAWEAASALPQMRAVDRAHRDAQLYTVAVTYGLLSR